METTMKKKGRVKATITSQKEEEGTVRKGPWTMEEDFILFNYILNHGEGLWNSVAKASGMLFCTYSNHVLMMFSMYITKFCFYFVNKV